jgi:serine/threonine protein kinase
VNLLPENGAAAGPGSSPEDSRVTQATLQYQAALEAGLPPDREEFLARHADIAGPLAAALRGLDLLRGGVLGFGPLTGVGTEPAAAAALAPGSVLGDFRLVREVGRGGMGVVYEAEQLSLGRRVALKVLPPQTASDPRSQRRFHTEAQAAAGLHHPHIVAVHAVGCSGNVHYYAMQFIEGNSLAGLLARSAGARGGPDARTIPYRPGSTPGEVETGAPPVRPVTPGFDLPPQGPGYFREAARLGIQAAEALQYAHDGGVVHRDIKPGNLLLDARGELWVADFGLALVRGAAGVTGPDERPGTLRYMSPEQARGTRGAVDHRTDVYSLGATLYELLTRCPAFPGEDRAELLSHIVDQEPRPPRRLDPAVPKDLETVVLKAMAKDPQDRYATAQELADDLRRFLDDQPIRARPPTLGRRASLWLRRRWRPVLVAGVSLLAGLAVSLGLAWRAWQQSEESRRAEARQRQRAEANQRLARQAIDEMYTRVASRLGKETPLQESVEREVLEKALRFYERLAEEGGNDPEMRLDRARILVRVGDIRHRFGRHGPAVEAFARATALLRELAGEYPREPVYRFDLARFQVTQGQYLMERGRYREAEPVLREALAGADGLVGDRPAELKFRLARSSAAAELGSALRSVGRSSESLPFQRRAVADCEELVRIQPGEPANRRQLATALWLLAYLLRAEGEPGAAEKACRRAVTLEDKLLKASPRDPACRARWARAAHLLIDLLLDVGPPADAEPLLGRRGKVIEGLTREFPKDAGHRFLMAEQHWVQGRWHRACGRAEQAEREARLAAGVIDGLLREDRASAATRNELALCLATGFGPRPPEARRAVELARAAAKEVPGNGWFRRTLGVAHYRAGNWREAARALEESLRLLPGGTPETLFFLAMSRHRLGNHQGARDGFDRAVRLMQRTAPGSAELRALRAEAEGVLKTGRR